MVAERRPHGAAEVAEGDGGVVGNVDGEAGGGGGCEEVGGGQDVGVGCVGNVGEVVEVELEKGCELAGECCSFVGALLTPLPRVTVVDFAAIRAWRGGRRLVSPGPKRTEGRRAVVRKGVEGSLAERTRFSAWVWGGWVSCIVEGSSVVGLMRIK